MFDPKCLVNRLASHQQLNDYPVLTEGGKFSIEQRGYFFGPSDKSKIFGRKVKIYMDRENDLLKVGIGDPVRVRNTISNLATYNIKLKRDNPQLTVGESKKLFQIFLGSPVRSFHWREMLLLKSMYYFERRWG